MLRVETVHAAINGILAIALANATVIKQISLHLIPAGVRRAIASSCEPTGDSTSVAAVNLDTPLITTRQAERWSCVHRHS